LNTDHGQGLSISELFLIDETVSLEGKLRALLHEGGALQDIPVSLLEAGDVTQGFLSAWPLQLEPGSAGR
jgi:hypothetical protein